MKKFQSNFLPAVAASVAALLTYGVACADYVYVSNTPVDTITEYNSGVAINTFGSSADLNGPTYMAFDPINGNLFVDNNNDGDVAEFTPGGVLVNSTFITGLSNPRGLAFDSLGNVYVANQSAGTVVEFGPTGGSVSTTLASALATPNGIAFDGSGNLYVADGTGNSITEIAPGDVVSTLPLSGIPLNGPGGLVYEDGSLYVVNTATPSILKITGGIASTFATDNLSGPKDLAFDTEGNLFVTDTGDGEITEYNSSGAYEGSFSAGNDPQGIVTAVPEPTTYALLTAGLGILLFLRRRTAPKI